MKNMLDTILKEDNTIELPQSVIEHLGLEYGEPVRILISDDSVILMSLGTFAERLLRKL